MREMLTEPMVNLVFARDLLSRASPASMEPALGYVERNMSAHQRAAAAQQERPRMPMNSLMGPLPGAAASLPRNQLMVAP